MGSEEQQGAATSIDELTRRYLARAYNMNTGALAWEDFGSPLGEFATRAVVAGGTLLPVGVTNDYFNSEDTLNGSDILIRAYDAKSLSVKSITVAQLRWRLGTGPWEYFGSSDEFASGRRLTLVDGGR